VPLNTNAKTTIKTDLTQKQRKHIIEATHSLYIGFGRTVMTCNSTIATVSLAALYFILFVNVLSKLIRLTWLDKKPGKESLKRFLALGLVFSAVRTAYLGAFPLTHEGCGDVSQSSGDNLLWSVFGTLPAVLFLSAFSVNITTLAKVYHTVTTVNEPALKLNNIALGIINLVIWTLLLVWYALPDGDTKDTIYSSYLWLLASTELLIAIFLLVYACLLYRRFFVRPNPMFKLWVASIICFLCFCVKSVLIVVLAFVFKGTYPPSLLVFYLIFSEIIPIVVMLIIFESSGKRGAELKDGHGKSKSHKMGNKVAEDDIVPDPAGGFVYREMQDPDPSLTQPVNT